MLKSAEDILAIASTAVSRKPNEIAEDLLEQAKVAAHYSRGLAKLKAMKAMVEAGVGSWNHVHRICCVPEAR